MCENCVMLIYTSWWFACKQIARRIDRQSDSNKLPPNLCVCSIIRLETYSNQSKNECISFILRLSFTNAFFVLQLFISWMGLWWYEIKNNVLQCQSGDILTHTVFDQTLTKNIRALSCKPTSQRAFFWSVKICIIHINLLDQYVSFYNPDKLCITVMFKC
jgi:hypothetical protein